MKNKVLIVDDDPATCEVLHEALNYENIEVKSLAWTYDIIGEIQYFTPQLVLLDYLLPEMNGGELCYQIKSNELTCSMPVIMFSAYPRVLHSLGNYGWDAFLEKPFDLWNLVAMIKTLSKPLNNGCATELFGGNV